jgi:hypothetical protein
MARKIKYTTVQIKEILAQPTLRLDPGYWIKKKAQALSHKQQATSWPQSPVRLQAKQKGIK